MEQRVTEIIFYLACRHLNKTFDTAFLTGFLELLCLLMPFNTLVIEAYLQAFTWDMRIVPSDYESTIILYKYSKKTMRNIASILHMSNSTIYKYVDMYDKDTFQIHPRFPTRDVVHMKNFLQAYDKFKEMLL